jgi:serine/threonine protein phosphatase PrpC
LDGHRGTTAVEYVQRNLVRVLEEEMHLTGQLHNNYEEHALERALELLDGDLVQRKETSGVCGIFSLLKRDEITGRPEELVVSNLGDCRAVLGRSGGLGALELSQAHSPGVPEERARIESRGGIVENVSYRVPGGGETAVDRIVLNERSQLAVSRALGNSDYKRRGNDEHGRKLPSLVSATPTFVRHAIDPERDEFLLLASDGVFEVMSSEETIEFVRRELRLANKQCLRVLGEHFGTLRIEVMSSRDVSKYELGDYVDFPQSRDQVKGYLMKKWSEDGSDEGRGTLHIRPTPPEAWEGGSWEGMGSDKNLVAKAWPCGIVCENLVDRCLELGSQDNLTAVVVLLSDTIGMEGHDGSTMDTLTQGGGTSSTTKRRRDAWQRRRNEE